MNKAFLKLYEYGYRHASFLPLFTRIYTGRQPALHEAMRWLDRHPDFAAMVNRLAFEPQPVRVGGVTLPHPAILAAGVVKGRGYANQQEALNALYDNKRVFMPGLRGLPLMLGALEIGSFTAVPNMGRWDNLIVSADTTKNAIGLDNPGARAAAQCLYSSRMPAMFGISLAPQPNDISDDQRQRGIRRALAFFQLQKRLPNWFTLNLSCPTIERDEFSPYRHRALIHAAADQLRGTSVPLWVKVAPNQSLDYYEQIVAFCLENGVKAIIATNTLDGVGGAALRLYAQQTHAALQQIVRRSSRAIDIVACGGIMTGDNWQAYQENGAKAFQYHSAIYLRGLLAAALILNEARNG